MDDVDSIDSPHGDDASGNPLHRTCPECGRDCVPEPFEVDREIRIGFSCPVHGVHTVMDPFEGMR